MQLFYAPDIINTGIHALPEEESKHAVKVLRKKAGDQLHLIDGKGYFYTARILSPHPKHCEIEVFKKIPENTPEHELVHIAIAPTKNNSRFEWFLEKATEIGIGKITPIICEHSERKVIKQNRLEKVLLAATKQSLKATIPVLNPAKGFQEFIETATSSEKFIAHCHHPENTLHLKDAYHSGKKVVILIGPEGDFSEEEVEMARQKDYWPVSLGSSRLRTETAGVVTCCTIDLCNQK